MIIMKIGKHRKRFIAKIFEHGTNCQHFGDYYQYTAQPCTISGAEDGLWEFDFASLSCDYDTGKCTVHITQRDWYHFIVDPAILRAGTPPRRKPPKVDFPALFERGFAKAKQTYAKEIRDLEPWTTDPQLFLRRKCGNWGNIKIVGIGGGSTLGRRLRAWCEAPPEEADRKCAMRVGKKWESWERGVQLRIETPADDRGKCQTPKRKAADAFVQELQTVFPLKHVTLEHAITPL